MSPKKFHDDDDHKQPTTKSGVVINGPRPTPLKLKQGSHTIHKQQFQKQIRPPIIIYTHSPEVIHTKPHEFMALVQKLTGASKDHQQQEIKKRLLKQVDHEYNNRNDHKEVCNNDSTTSVTHDEKLDKMMRLANTSPMFNPPSNPSVNDIPLFTPNANDYFCSPHRRFYGFSDHMVSSSPNLNASLISPSGGSMLEIFKGLPEY
uniref:VQ motif-containing protein 8, chloroplastic-like n=1 Tax=Erigeron canadensis TaxID=72917 RepID=UPI001CB8E430|nr:VQ motif-containing protein 8, chloroplastic-like [Erigeron canadensis]